MRLVLALVSLIMITSLASESRTLLHVVGAGRGKNLLANPSFEQETSGWKPFCKGFSVDSTIRRSGRLSIRCENSDADVEAGAFQTIILNQESPKAIRACAWSKAENVSPAKRGDYALYLDIQYTDGSWVWGKLDDFSIGTHGWQYAEVSFDPEKPIKLVNVYLLLRRCVGKAWFDDCRFEEIEASEGTALFDGMIVSKSTSGKGKQVVNITSPDGIDLVFASDGSILSGCIGKTQLPAGGGFYMRDVGRGSDVLGLDKLNVQRKASGKWMLSGKCGKLGLSLDVAVSANKSYLRFDCEARNETRYDRAITIGFAIPMPKESWHWWHSIRNSEKTSGDRSFCDGVPIEAGAVGQMSKYPFACMSGRNDAINLAIPMDEPCVYRIGYNGALSWYFIAFDLGFCPDQDVVKQKFSFIIYRTDGAGGMRAAVDKYYRIFPEFFVKRVEREGNWMAFLRVRSVQGWEDFGFAFHEGDNDIEWDSENGIYSFRYTEPMSYWLPMEKSLPRTAEQVFKMIDENFKQTNDTALRNWASAVKTCLTYDEYGKPWLFFFDAPWCDGAMFLLNPNPAIPKGDMPATRASISWSREIAEKLYGDITKPQLAGEYLDSAEMGAGYVNTRREHFRYAIRPLSFCRRTKKPAILQILSTYEFARTMADDVHKLGKLMMANGIPTSFGFMAHLLDVMGIETNWLADGKFNPPPDELMDLRRTLCYKKPFCFLMNTDYEAFNHSMVERYFQRCLFWGMFPGFFSPDAATRLYFEQPKYYNRDRDLFKKYVPVIQKIARAGWEPITMAKATNPQVAIERFGPGNDGALYFTVRNLASKRLTARLRLDAKLRKPKSVVRLPEGKGQATVDNGDILVELDPDEVAVVEVLH